MMRLLETLPGVSSGLQIVTITARVVIVTFSCRGMTWNYSPVRKSAVRVQSV
jgi:hypothetical protein